MHVDEKVYLCDRELGINYYVRSPVRYACHRTFSLINSFPQASTHRTLQLDVMDRPVGGVGFDGGRVLVEGALWRLAERGEYLYLKVSSPCSDGDGMDAVFARHRGQVKVFIDTPWVGQTGFAQAWGILLQTVFRASLDTSHEQLVNGIGLKVGKRGLLLKAILPDSSAVLNVLSRSFPCLGENRLLLRREDDAIRLYVTPWTRDVHRYRLTETRLEKIVLLISDSESQPLSAHRIRLYFALSLEELALARPDKVNEAPIEQLPAVVLNVASLENLADELVRLASD